MPRNSTGQYSLPAGNPVADSTVISSTWANPTMGDLANEITQSLDRNGRGGMLVAFKNVDGTKAAPGMTFTTEPSSGIYRAATNDIRMSVGNDDATRWVDDNSQPVGSQRPFQIWDGGAFRDVLYEGGSLPQLLPDGTVSAPSLAFVSETTLGLYKKAAGVLGVAGNLDVTGTATIKDGNNSVFIEGRTDGGSLAGTGAANISVIDGAYSTNPIAGSRIAMAHAGGAGQRGGITFASKNTDDDSIQPTVQGVLTPAGNWGFGTTNPQYKVEVAGTLGVSGTTTVTGGIVRGTTAQTYEAGVLGYSTAGFGFIFRPPQAGATAAHKFQKFDGTDILTLAESGATAITANIENPLTITSSHNGIVYNEVFNVNTGANAAVYFGIVTQNLANSGTIRSGMFFDSSNHLNFINGEAGGAGIVLDDNNAVTMSGDITISKSAATSAATLFITNTGNSTGDKMDIDFTSGTDLRGRIRTEVVGSPFRGTMSFITALGASETTQLTLGDSAGTAQAQFAGALDVTGIADANYFTSVNSAWPGSPAAGEARLIGLAADGAVISGRGTTTDFLLTNKNGAHVLKVATGTNNVQVVGSLSVSGLKNFQIDHPLTEKADTHYLFHSVIEAPQADLIYSGTSELVNGAVEVNIDEFHGMTEGTFVALNRNIRVFTTNETDWEPIKGSVIGNILSISCQDGSCSDKVSWLVIGERQDEGIKSSDWTDEEGRLIVEPLKPDGELLDRIKVLESV